MSGKKSKSAAGSKPNMAAHNASVAQNSVNERRLRPIYGEKLCQRPDYYALKVQQTTKKSSVFMNYLSTATLFVCDSYMSNQQLVRSTFCTRHHKIIKVSFWLLPKCNINSKLLELMITLKSRYPSHSRMDNETLVYLVQIKI